MTIRYPELQKVLPKLLAYYEPLVAAQHMGTIGNPEKVPVPSLIVAEIKEIMRQHRHDD